MAKAKKLPLAPGASRFLTIKMWMQKALQILYSLHQERAQFMAAAWAAGNANERPEISRCIWLSQNTSMQSAASYLPVRWLSTSRRSAAICAR
ncbi:hypothetical protein CRH03_25615 [Clostridium sp. HMb25]|nr:hypothetical protein CRH03_25615 [Clostridium sp. HMb25]